MAEEGADIGFEDGMSFLPAHILREACGDVRQDQLVHPARHYQYHHVNGLKSHPRPPQRKSGRKFGNNKPRNGGTNRGSGGPGMQAIFLEPSHNKSCGTGVFLPRIAGADIQPTKKPACSVLLPSRVVQALNLNAEALSLHITPRQDPKTSKKDRYADISFYKKDEAEEVRGHCSAISQDKNYSPEIFLPKEWSY